MAAYIVTETGVVAEYPRGAYIVWDSSRDYIATIYADENKNTFVAKVPRGCIVSFHRPSVVQQAADAKQRSLEQSLELVTACVKTLGNTWANRQRLKKLKSQLRSFDARSGCWNG